MAVEEAGVKISLRAGDVSGLKKLEKEVERARGKMKDALVGGLKDAAGAMGNVMKTGLMAGAVGAAAIIRNNMQAEQGFRKIAFAMKAAGREGLSYAQLQRGAIELAKKWGGTQESLAAGMSKAFEKSGNADFALKVMDGLAMTSRASGVEMATLGELAGELNSKFGVTAEQMPDALGAVMSLAAKGGQSVEELTAEMDALGKSTARAGVSGLDGFTKMVALSQKMADAAGGETAAMSQLGKVLVKLGPGADAKMKAQLKAMGIDGKGGALSTLEALMKKTGGDEGQLSKVLGAQGASLLSGGLGKDGFQEAMKAASDGTMRAGEVQKTAAENMESGAAKIEQAMAGLAEQLNRKEVTEAMKGMFDLLPKLTEGLTGIVNFASKHPLLAGGLAVGSQTGAAGGIVSIASALMQHRAAQAALQAATAAQTTATSALTVATEANTASKGIPGGGGGGIPGVPGVGAGAGAGAGAGGFFAGGLVANVAAVGVAVAAIWKAVEQAKKGDEEHKDDQQALDDIARTRTAMGMDQEFTTDTYNPITGTKYTHKYQAVGDHAISNDDYLADKQEMESRTARGLDLPHTLGRGELEAPMEALARAQRMARAAGRAIDDGHGTRGIDTPDGGIREERWYEKQARRFGDAPAAPAQGRGNGMSAEQNALLQQMLNSNNTLPSKLAAQELRVRVVNMDEGGGIRPGHAPRK